MFKIANQLLTLQLTMPFHQQGMKSIALLGSEVCSIKGVPSEQCCSFSLSFITK